MEQNQDQFYVVLMSNNSMEHYPDNVLSAFSNKLPIPLKLEGNWVVGLTHLSYGPFASFQRMEMAAPENGAIDDDVETFDPVSATPTVVEPPPKKRQRKRKRDREYRTQKQEASDEKKVIIKISDVHSIVLKQSDLRELTYEKHHLNCGKLLKVLAEKIEPRLDDNDPRIFYEIEMMRRRIKHQIIDLINEEDWIAQSDVIKHARKKDEFLMHIYLGSRRSTNIPIRYLEYDSIETFICEIVYQLPIHERRKEPLSQLFNLFHTSYDLISEKAIIPRKTDINLYIPLSEYGTSSGLDTRELVKNNPNIMEHGISMEDIIALFRENLQYKDETLSASEKLELRLRIKNAIVDVLRGNALNGPYIPKQYKKNDLPLNVPVEKTGDNSYGYYRAVLEAKNYDHEDQFLNEIYNQIPIEKRDKTIFLDTLNQAFVKSINTKRSASETTDMVSQTQPLQSFAVDYADLSNPKAPAVQFPKNVNTSSAPIQEQPLPPPPPPPTLPSPVADIQPKSRSPSPSAVPKKPDIYLTGGLKLAFSDAAAAAVDNAAFAAASAAAAAGAKASPKMTEIVASKRDIHKNRFIFVYSDIIRGRIIGDTIGRFLRVIPLTDNTRDLQFRHVEFVPVEKNYIESITILLANNFGERIQFKASTVPTYVSLCFKRL